MTLAVTCHSSYTHTYNRRSTMLPVLTANLKVSRKCTMVLHTSSLSMVNGVHLPQAVPLITLPLMMRLFATRSKPVLKLRSMRLLRLLMLLNASGPRLLSGNVLSSFTRPLLSSVNTLPLLLPVSVLCCVFYSFLSSFLFL